ncbi:uncharacterized protein LOC132614030 [Lycium barbarum]|uniref:uncharacterized protein LOC132614030 n=1 Tax=Lycium barbarum TaxID=112863 RepID=UPI00293F73E6|nr:uncharacterized protein LOC132614030 [Lycium barbarum]
MLKQGLKSVEAYFDEFEDLQMKSKIKEHEECTIIRFVANLNQDISKPMRLKTYNSLEEAFHDASKCQGRGHIANECPNRRTITIVRDGYRTDDEHEGGVGHEKEGERSECEGDSDEEVEIRYEEALNHVIVARRAMEALAREESDKRENLLHARRKIVDKVCSLTIDGGSCTNAVSQFLVESMKFHTHKHTNPYKLQWFNDGGEMRVNKQAIMKFSIGKYQDEILCDVVPMQACHLLLGRPWQFDVDAQHSGRTNQYSFVAYRSNPEETKEVQRQVHELLKKELLKESRSQCAIPVILVPKKDGTWRMCIDSRVINKIAVKYRHLIPRLDDMLDELCGSTMFSKIDLRSGYHQIRMNPGDEWKMAFKTNFCLYEWLVMPCGLTNAPSTFMRLMNHVLKPFINTFVVVYFDDILVYSKSIEEHVDDLRQVFNVLLREKLFANLKKCSFCVDKVVFLGFVVCANGLEVNEEKVEMTGFESLKGLYSQDPDFKTICEELTQGRRVDRFQLIDGFLFKDGRVCVPMSSWRELFIKEAHSGGMMGHFEVGKTHDILGEQFYWPKMRHDIE